MKTKLILNGAGFFVLMAIVATSCTKDKTECQTSCATISPNLKSIAMTKSTRGEDASDPGRMISIIPLHENPQDSLFLLVYEKDMPDMQGDPAVRTKGAEVTTENISSFRMKAFAEAEWISLGDISEHEAGEYFGPTSVRKSGGVWKMDTERKWLNEVAMSFWSWNEIEPAVDFEDGTDHATLSGYTVPQTVSDQKDLVYAYNREIRSFDGNGRIRNGKTASVDIHFSHALSEINFDISNVVSDYTVSKIQLSNIHSGGDCAITVVDGVPNFAWPSEKLAEKTNYSQTFGASDFSADGRYVEGSDKNFFLIPQTLPSDASMSVTFRKNGSDETLTRNISTNNGVMITWLPGKRYTYKLSKSAYSYDYTFEFMVEGQSEVSLSQSITGNKTDSDFVLVDVVSTKERDDASGTASHQGWTIKSYKLEGEDEVAVNASSFTDAETGITAEADSDNDYIFVEAGPRTRVGKGTHAYWTDQSRSEERGWSPDSWAGYGTIDLSMMDYTKDVMSQSVNAFEMTTSNCYVIRHAGRYKLPLVYGNAMNRGQCNEQSYYPNADGSIPNGDDPMNGEGDFYRLVRFENHLGNGITDPFIENNAECVMGSAEILWQSDADVIKDIQLTGTVRNAGEYDNRNVRYVEFTVDPDEICQNVSLIAVRDIYGQVAWSWNIWTTNDPALTEGSIDVRNYDGNPYRFFPISNIGRIDSWEYEERKSMQITLQQEGSGKTVVLTINQPTVSDEGFNALYQFGRKDPFLNKDTIHSHSSSLSSAISFSVPPPLSTLAQYISNPTTFYEFRLSQYPNPLERPYLNLWTGKSCDIGPAEQNSSIIKTVYDPSPIGYKVPAGKAFTGFTTTGTGISGQNNSEDVNGFWDTDNAYLYTCQGSGHTINTGGETICFPVTGVRAGGSGRVTNKTQGWYFTSNVNLTISTSGIHNVTPILMIFQFNNGELYNMRPATTAGQNANAVRPVIDVTMPDNPIR